MTIEIIFILQFILSLIVFSFLMKWIASSWLNKLPRNEAIFWLAIPHTFRHIGMSFLVPGLLSGTLPSSFSIPAAYGDLTAVFSPWHTLAEHRPLGAINRARKSVYITMSKIKHKANNCITDKSSELAPQ